MLQFTNAEKTSATFNGVSFVLSAPSDWDSIGDGPTRDAVKSWVAAGNTPALAAAVDWREPVLSDFRSRREIYLNRLAGIATFKGDDAAIRLAASTFRQRLLDIPQDASVTGAANAAAMQLAILMLYRAAALEAQAAAPSGKTEFDRIAK